MGFFFSKPIAGIDISDSSVEVLFLNSNKTVAAYGREDLPVGLVEKGGVKDQTKLSEIIKSIFDKFDSRYSKDIKASIVLPKAKTFLSHFEYDPKSYSEDAVRSQLEKEIAKEFLSFPENIVWDHIVLKPDKGSPIFPRVLYAVADKETVYSYYQVLDAAGIKPVSFEVEPVVLEKALIPDEKDGDNAYSIIVDIGAQATSTYVFTPYRDLEYASNIKVGGEAITKLFVEKKGISFDDAEKLKRQHGFLNSDLQPLMIEAISKVEEEIGLFLHRYERIENKTIGKIILAGGSALLPGIDGYFQKVFNKTVLIGNPLLKLKDATAMFPRETPPILFANVIGLGLNNLKKRGPSEDLNLLPTDVSALKPPQI